MRVFVVLISCLLVSCSVQHKPVLIPIGYEEQNLQRCEDSFLYGNWQLVHSISFEPVSGYPITLMGVTVLQEGRLKTALMGVEGLVLFEAEQKRDGTLFIKRALPPFDSVDFATALMADVQSLFLVPGRASLTKGRDSDGQLLCRYLSANGQVTDVLPGTRGWQKITIYDKQDNPVRSLIATGYKAVGRQFVAKDTLLSVPGAGGYALKLHLLDADMLP